MAEQIKEFIKIISLHKNNELAMQAEKINALNINWYGCSIFVVI